jgi:AcrR family transcriptional regulator
VTTSLRVVDDTEPAPERDGRRLRSQDSRARIVASMLALIMDGEIAPGAEAVAARAQVGLRTVFRHFKDMESLYAEMGQAIEAEMRTAVAQPFTTSAWRERLVELVHRRSAVFERIAPFRRASDANRHRSPFLAEANTRLVEALREVLRRVLPPEIAADESRFEALDLLLSFESWMRLRRDQGLSVRRAHEVLEATVGKIAG